MLLRVAGGLVIAAVVNLAAIIIVALAGPLGFVGACFWAGIMHLGFLGFGLTAAPRSPLRPMRLTVAIAMLESAFLMSALAWPSRPQQLSFAAAMLTAILAGGILVVSARHRPRLARGILAMLGVLGLLMIIGATLVLSGSAAALKSGLADQTIGFAFVFACGAAWLTSCWHGRKLWRLAATPDLATQ